MPVIAPGRGPVSKELLGRLPGPLQGLVDTVLPADDPMLPAPPMMAVGGAAKGPLRFLANLLGEGRSVPNPGAAPAPTRLPIPAPTAELAAVGEEGLYNATRPAQAQMGDIYEMIKARMGGRGR